MRNRIFSVGLVAVLAMFAATLFGTGTLVAAQQEIVLHSFNNKGTDGYIPVAGLVFGASGNLYGTTPAGGAHNLGIVYELTPTGGGGWAEAIVHSFNFNGVDGDDPSGSLVADAMGNLYGATRGGGTYNYGTVFELRRTLGGGAEKILFSFNKTDGYEPYSVVFDASGNLYGTTYAGGAYGYGDVFELVPEAGGVWRKNILLSFNSNDGAGPTPTVIFDQSGNLYGTTAGGGAYNNGTVFELMPTSAGWTEKILHSFNLADADGASPLGVVLDSSGNLYGTTFGGGAYSGGTVFELIPSSGGGWTEKLLLNFVPYGIGGYLPYAGLMLDVAGNLYGTTAYGGAYDCGTAFELARGAAGGWAEKVLHSFNPNGTDGQNPYAPLISDASGNLYGTTTGGGAYNEGTVFEIKP